MNDMYDVDYVNIDGNHVHVTAVIDPRVKMGKGNIIMPYAVIGLPGFIRGMLSSEYSVVIGDNNRIGCHACIMSGSVSDTIIGDNNLIMNHVNIGHDVEVSDNCEIGAGSIIGGHAKIEADVKVKINATIRNRVKIHKGALVGMGSVVTRDVREKGLVFGNPATEKL